jgi:hypothetical protein
VRLVRFRLCLSGQLRIVFAFFADSRYMPCPECGASLGSEDPAEHSCDPTRRVEFQMFRMRAELARLEDEVAEYLRSPEGRFELWYAERHRAA